jgi:hypothetical protein
VNSALYLIYTTTLPDFEDGSERLLVDRDLGGESGELVDPTLLQFVSTAVAAREHSEVLVSAISEWFSELGGSDVRLELIATAPARMSADQRARFEVLDQGAWSINTAFVAFRRESSAAREEARALVQGSALLGQ